LVLALEEQRTEIQELRRELEAERRKREELRTEIKELRGELEAKRAKKW
jgi:septal ring factor EnvC (AmiA/AmiB activator)